MTEGISRRRFLKLSAGTMSAAAATEASGFGFNAGPIRARTDHPAGQTRQRSAQRLPLLRRGLRPDCDRGRWQDY